MSTVTGPSAQPVAPPAVAGPGVARPGVARRAGDAIAAAARSRAAWVFAGAWLGSAAVLTVSGQGFPVGSVLLGAAYLTLSLVTVVMTEPAPPDRAAPRLRPRLWVQVGLIGVVVVLAGWGGLVFHDVVPSDAAIPLWTPFVESLRRLGGELFGNDGYIANPVTYALIPLIVLLLAGARLKDLGFARGHRVTRTLVLWSAIPVAVIVAAVVAGQLTIGRVAGRLVSNSLQNGFFEEFLFRGALQTRLRRLWTPEWAIVVQALVFGAWHLGLGFTNTDHAGIVPALASTIVNQAVIGLAFGVVFERTRNLLVPSVAHVLVNSMG